MWWSEESPEWQPDAPETWERAAAVAQQVRSATPPASGQARPPSGSRSRRRGSERRRRRRDRESDRDRDRRRDREGRRDGHRGAATAADERQQATGRTSRRPSRSSRKRKHGLAFWALLGAGAFLLILGGVVADAYYQSYRVYKDLRDIQPQVAAMRASLAKGRIPADDPFESARSLAVKARDDVDHTRFTMNIAGAIPFLNRPVQAVRMAASAALEQTQAALIVRGIAIDLLGESAVVGKTGGVTGPAAHGAKVLNDGMVDIELLKGLIPRLGQVVDHLAVADRDARRIPHIPGFQRFEELRAKAVEESTRAHALASRTLSVMRLVPEFLAEGGERTYYVALQQNAALRGTGGSVLAYALLKVEDGALTVDRTGSIYDIDDRFHGVPVKVPPDLQWYIKNARVNPRIANGMNYSPNFPLVAEAWKKQVEKVTGQQIDGAIALDPVAVAALIKETHPIKVEAYPDPITSDNVVRVVEHDQFALPQAQQRALPAQLVKRAFNIVLAQPKDLVGMLHRLGQALGEKRIQIWTDQPDLQDLVSQLGWDGALRRNPGDYLYLVQENRRPNKIDYFGAQSITYTATVNDDGSVDSNYQVTLANNIPVPKGNDSKFIGLSRSMMNLYVAKDARFESVDPAEVSGPSPGDVHPPGFVQHIEGDFRVLTQTISAEPKQTATLSFRYSTPDVVQKTGAGSVYQLTVQHQPLYRPADLTIRVILPKGAKPESAPGWTVNGNVATFHTVLNRDVVLRLAF